MVFLLKYWKDILIVIIAGCLIYIGNEYRVLQDYKVKYEQDELQLTAIAEQNKKTLIADLKHQKANKTIKSVGIKAVEKEKVYEGNKVYHDCRNTPDMLKLLQQNSSE